VVLVDHAAEDPADAVPGPRSGAARPAPSAGPGACAAPRSVRRPQPGTGSAAGSGSPSPAARPDAAAAVAAGSASPRHQLAETPSRACKNEYRPDTPDSRRRSVRAAIPPAFPPASCRRPRPPARRAVMNASTSPVVTTSGDLPAAVKNTFSRRQPPARCSAGTAQPQTPGTHPPAAPPAAQPHSRRHHASGSRPPQPACRPPSPRTTGLQACQDLPEDHPHIMQMRTVTRSGPMHKHTVARRPPCLDNRDCHTAQRPLGEKLAANVSQQAACSRSARCIQARISVRS
jgi:hypothetical protein